MKILHVVHSLDKGQGGPPAVVTGMCAALADRGHEICLYATESADPFVTSGSASFELRYFRVQWEPYQASLSMAKALHTNVGRFDLVHIHMLHRFPQAMAAYTARSRRIPYCIQPHGALAPYVYQSGRKLARHAYVWLIERRHIELAAGMVHTAQQEEQWTNEIGLRPRKSYIVPVGADITKLSRPANPKSFRDRFNLGSQRIILWMGRIVEAKGLALICEAFARSLYQMPETSLVMVGPDPVGHRAELELLATNLGIRDRVVFTGALGGEDKQQALGSAEVFLLPSHSENFGLVALEAMALGCPVILSPGVCIANDVSAAGAGLVIERDAAAWGEMLTSLLADTQRRVSMGEAARHFAWQYDWSNIAAELERSYSAMLES